MKALIITAKGVQDQEFLYPYYRLQEAQYDVDVATPDGAQCSGILGLPVEPCSELDNLFLHQLRHRHVKRRYDLVVIPGGVKSMERLRLHENAVQAVALCRADGMVVASICSGAQLLISAGIVKGRRIAAYYAMRVDVENAGAEFVDAPAVVCDRIVSSPHYKHLGPWMAATLAEVERVRGLVSEGAACAAAL